MDEGSLPVGKGGTLRCPVDLRRLAQVINLDAYRCPSCRALYSQYRLVRMAS